METGEVILVNERDEAVAVMDKMEAHRQGLLHRAFSIFIFNDKGEMLLQQRALQKYHSAGLWSNACCSHPRYGEDIKSSAARRLLEEMGIETGLEKIFDFIYKASFENGLTEHEFDHVLAGEYSGPVLFNTEEVMDACYKDMNSILKSLESAPQIYTTWFRLAFPRIETWWKQRYSQLPGFQNKF